MLVASDSIDSCELRKSTSKRAAEGQNIINDLDICQAKMLTSIARWMKINSSCPSLTL
jgi:hypothetical protein